MWRFWIETFDGEVTEWVPITKRVAETMYKATALRGHNLKRYGYEEIKVDPWALSHEGKADES